MKHTATVTTADGRRQHIRTGGSPGAYRAQLHINGRVIQESGRHYTRLEAVEAVIPSGAEATTTAAALWR